LAVDIEDVSTVGKIADQKAGIQAFCSTASGISTDSPAGSLWLEEICSVGLVVCSVTLFYLTWT
jgi:hypothetical protein